MKNNLKKALEIIQKEINVSKESCVICSETTEESTLIGTKDAYLNVISCLLKQLIDDQKWSDEIRKNMLQLPTDDAWLVGTELHKTHESLLKRLKEFYTSDPEVIRSIENDPQFKLIV